MSTPEDALRRAIDAAGGPAEVARFITARFEPITAQAVCGWRVCPPRRVLQLEAAASGKVTRHELRPELYPIEERAA